MVTFREATSHDAKAISRLHADSWRSAYRGVLSDDYLDQRVYSERAVIWQHRFSEQAQKPFFAILAELEGQPVGFACVFPDEHPTYGSFLDNLHVIPQRTGQGIGRQLLTAVARRLLAHGKTGGLYLWVVEQNIRARRFYASAGAAEVERAVLPMPDGAQVAEIRCL
jgi:GNAT superfamily N-acetyltransferase